MGTLEFRTTSEGILRWQYLDPTEEERAKCLENPTVWFNENVAGKDPDKKCRAMRSRHVIRDTTRSGDTRFVIGGECGTSSIYMNGRLTQGMKAALFKFRLEKSLGSNPADLSRLPGLSSDSVISALSAPSAISSLADLSSKSGIDLENEGVFKATFAQAIHETDARDFFDNLDEMLQIQFKGNHPGIEFDVLTGGEFMEVHVDIGPPGDILQGFVEGVQVYKELYRDWLINPTNRHLDRKISFFGKPRVDLNPSSKLSVLGTQAIISGDLFVPCPEDCVFSACNADNGDVTFHDEASGTVEGGLERIEVKRYCLEPGTDHDPCACLEHDEVLA